MTTPFVVSMTTHQRIQDSEGNRTEHKSKQDTTFPPQHRHLFSKNDRPTRQGADWRPDQKTIPERPERSA